MKTVQGIEQSNVAVLVLDAAEGVSEQDAHVAGYILERGRALVVAVNKWDATDKDARERIKRELAWKLVFLGFAEVHYLSAKSGKGLGELMRSVDGAYAAAMAKLSTPKLTRTLMAAVERQPPPRKGLTDGDHIERELMLVKVRAVGDDREELKRMTDIFRGRVIDVTDKTYTIELTGTGHKLDRFLQAIDHNLILETVRTGASGIGRGDRILKL